MMSAGFDVSPFKRNLRCHKRNKKKLIKNRLIRVNMYLISILKKRFINQTKNRRTPFILFAVRIEKSKFLSDGHFL